jgi:hypothetical protein
VPTPSEVLAPDREETPLWLAAGDPVRLPPDILGDFLASRIVYYPGSGTDWHGLELFGGSDSAHCFVQCDYKKDGIDEVRERLQPEDPLHPEGYHPLLLQDLTAEEVRQLCGIEPDDHWHPHEPHGAANWPGPGLTGGIWAVLERQDGLHDTHARTRLAFLHICAEAVWTYHVLWAHHAVAPYGIVLQDHGWGGNWLNCQFGRTPSPKYPTLSHSPLLRMAETVGQPRPTWLLVAHNTEPWPGYEQVSDSGEHGLERCLYRLRRRNR